MQKIEVKIRRLNHSKESDLPDYESAGASGMDLRASLREPVMLQPGEIRYIPTGLAVSLPQGYEAQIRPRSGLALHHGIGLVNSPGTIDADYRGEVGIIMINWGTAPYRVKDGDRVAQMVISKIYRAKIVEVEVLEESPRGHGGFGHTGVS